jgi:phage protein U
LIRNQGYEGSGSAWIRIKGIVQPFELGGETRLIRSAVK